MQLCNRFSFADMLFLDFRQLKAQNDHDGRIMSRENVSLYGPTASYRFQHGVKDGYKPEPGMLLESSYSLDGAFRSRLGIALEGMIPIVCEICATSHPV